MRGIVTRRDLDAAAGHGAWRRNRMAPAPRPPDDKGRAFSLQILWQTGGFRAVTGHHRIVYSMQHILDICEGATLHVPMAHIWYGQACAKH